MDVKFGMDGHSRRNRHPPVLYSMSVVNLENISNDELKKRLASQVNLDDWGDECSKCGYPRVLHKELHREAACTKEQELPNILKENWKEYRKRVKPILKSLKEEL